MMVSVIYVIVENASHIYDGSHSIQIVLPVGAGCKHRSDHITVIHIHLSCHDTRTISCPHTVKYKTQIQITFFSIDLIQYNTSYMLFCDGLIADPSSLWAHKVWLTTGITYIISIHIHPSWWSWLHTRII